MAKNKALSKQDSLPFLFWTFFKIGCTAFGGFMALVSVVQSIIVEKYGLLTDEQLLKGISLGSILPGPLAVNVVSFTGYQIRGISGAFVCATAVILPSFALLLGLSFFYFEYGDLPALKQIFAGIIPAVAAIVMVVSYRLGKKNLSQAPEYLLAIVATLLLLSIGGFFMTISIVMTSGIIGLWLFFPNKNKLTNDFSINKKRIWAAFQSFAILIVIIIVLSQLSFPNHPELQVFKDLLSTFSSMGIALFGGGYVLIPMIQETVVTDFGWLTEQEFADGIAMGQITPGPILISAAFIGYKVKGILGATIATIGMFFPPACLMIIAANVLSQVEDSPYVKAAFRGIKAAVVGMVFAAGLIIAQTMSPTFLSAFIFGAAIFSLLKWNISVLLLIPLAGLVGLIGISYF